MTNGKVLEPNTKPAWTVMVYMAADSSPSFYRDAMADITEMTEADFDENVKVVVHADAPPPWEKKCWEIRNKTAKLIPCDHKSLLEFFQSHVSKDDPSAKYLAVLWGHAEGIDWKKKALPNSSDSASLTEANRKRFALGSQGPYEIGELGKALNELELGVLNKDNVIVGFDACLMSMVEVYYEIKEKVGWAVAANDEIPTFGWPYKQILNRLREAPEMTPEDMAKAIVDECTNWYSKESPESKVSFSACHLNTNTFNDLPQKAIALTNWLKANLHASEKAIWGARDFAEDLAEKAYVDLHAFCVQLPEQKSLAKQPELKHALENVTSPVAEAVNNFVIKSGFSDVYPQKYSTCSRALSICFPESEALEGTSPDVEIDWRAYKRLQFNAVQDARDDATTWPDFLKDLWKKPKPPLE